MAIQVLDGYDNKSQADRVAALILPGETLYLVYDCKGRGSGFVGVTSHRVVVQDDGFTTKHIQSIPYTRINSVGVDSKAGWGKGSSFLSFSAGIHDWAFTFKGAAKARKAYQRIMEQLLAMPVAAPEGPPQEASETDS